MWIGYLMVILSATGFGFMAIFAVFAYESGINIPTLLFLRFSIATCVFFIYIFFKYRKFRIATKEILLLLLMGGGLYTAQSSLFFSAVKYIPTSLAALLLYLFPVIVPILTFFWYKEKLSKSMGGIILLTLAGIVLVLGTPAGEIQFIGVLLAVGAAIVYSIYIVIGSRVTHSLSPIVMSAFISLFAMTSFLIFGLTTNSLSFHFANPGWLPIIAIALFSTVLAISTFFIGVKFVGPTRASVLSTIEPVITILFSALLLSEQMTWTQILGAGIVLSGSVLVILEGGRNRNVKLDPSRNLNN